MASFFKKLLLLLFIVASIGGYVVWQDYRAFSDAPMSLLKRELVIDVKLGTSFQKIVRTLRREGVSDAPELYWRALAHEMSVLDGLHAGEYAVAVGMTPRTLLERMAKGRVIHHRFTIIEGWRFSDLRLALSREPLLEQTLAGLSEADIMAELGRPDLPAEGRFLPETYGFVRGQKDIEVLRRAFLAMQAALEESWAALPQDTPLKSMDELLTLASIVEKETGQAEDRDDVAGVFVRRLKIGMRLQTDPTVIYGIGPAYNGNITRKHLETDTPYNTYTRMGLPPTPIALPGRDAINAVVHPADGDALYFVSRGDGSSQFSSSLQEHNSAVAKYQLRRRPR